MHPERKLFQYVALGVIFMMYLVLTISSEWTPWPVISASAIGFLGSFALYRMLTLGVVWLVDRWPWLLKQILGPAYLQGTWVTRVRTKRGYFRIVIEHYEQTYSKLLIKGRSYKPNGDLDAEFLTHTAQIDVNKGLVHAFYENNVLYKDYPVEAIGRFSFHRASPHGPPTEMTGYAIDVDAAAIKREDPQAKIKIVYEHMENISRKMKTFEDAFKEAKEEHFAGYIADHGIDDEGKYRS